MLGMTPRWTVITSVALRKWKFCYIHTIFIILNSCHFETGAKVKHPITSFLKANSCQQL